MGNWQAALQEFDTIKQAMAGQPDLFHIRFDGDPDWIMALIGAGRLADADAMIAAAMLKSKDLFGQDLYALAEIQGLAAVNHILRGDREKALKLFTTCTPALLTKKIQPGADTGGASAFNQRRTFILEHYLELLALIHTGKMTAPNIENPAAEAFQLAEVLRGSSVKKAVGALSARIAAGNDDLADLVRREQDAVKQVSALRSVLYNALSQPEKNYDIINELNTNIAELSAARNAIQVEIESRFPEYANLTNPKPTRIAAIQKYMHANEALIAFYVGERQTFAWGFPQTGKAAFAAIPENEATVAKRVDHIRKALAPQADTLVNLPVFDIDAAYSLYKKFLDPVKPGWGRAKHLSVVPHGPLGYLPVSLLPTARVSLKQDSALYLAGYRSIPWLIRDHSITVLPAADVLITLRKMPPGADQRQVFAGFGDPLFSQNQLNDEKQGNQGPVTRGAGKGQPGLLALKTRAIRITEKTTLDDEGLNTASLSMLQPLPDTRDEVLSIAAALQADPSQDIFLGSQASEKQVKSLDLSNRQILIFATHGLVPGDLNGLHQPALALSAPELAGDSENDGLLTMGEIMGLRLDADWVILSACNTAAGEGAGAEAASGLGRAFFYAGTRAILLSNWPVESQSAKLLTTDVFKRQSADPLLSRAAALQAGMLNLLDKGVYKDPTNKKPLFAYAHPIFWAPFTLVGDGSGAVGSMQQTQ